MILGIRPNIVPKLPQSKNNQPNYASNTAYNVTSNPITFGMTHTSSKVKYLKDLIWKEFDPTELQGLIAQISEKTGHKFDLKEMKLLALDERVLNDLLNSKTVKFRSRTISVTGYPNSIYRYIVTDNNNVQKALVYDDSNVLKGFAILNNNEVKMKYILCRPDGTIGIWQDLENGKIYTLDKNGNVDGFTEKPMYHQKETIK